MVGVVCYTSEADWYKGIVDLVRQICLHSKVLPESEAVSLMHARRVNALQTVAPFTSRGGELPGYLFESYVDTWCLILRLGSTAIATELLSPGVSVVGTGGCKSESEQVRDN